MSGEAVRLPARVVAKLSRETLLLHIDLFEFFCAQCLFVCARDPIGIHMSGELSAEFSFGFTSIDNVGG